MLPGPKRCFPADGSVRARGSCRNTVQTSAKAPTMWRPPEVKKSETTSAGAAGARRSYTADFKPQAVLFAESSNNCGTQPKVDTNEKLISSWRNPATGRCGALEKELKLNVEEELAKGLEVSCEGIQMKDGQLSQRDGIGRSTFRASWSWVQKSMRRNGLSLPTRTMFMTVLTGMWLQVFTSEKF
ncbi:hypothetical protein HPB49_006795 [Dermacentor silvarum]|uniref:Uncharacterized protein n=1 Tax=Dermacentor silvarum TaxID=543639 RepID=A0ACB8D3D4_DERSI|nr:hypothetical protein HPB49_006795 [Dermacentor silvarum]